MRKGMTSLSGACPPATAASMPSSQASDAGSGASDGESGEPAADCGGAPPGGASCSFFLINPPAFVYQQGPCSSPLSVVLSPANQAALRGACLYSSLSLRLVRFDGAPLLSYDTSSGSMVPYALPDDAFTPTLAADGSQVVLRPLRKRLPVSSTFGGCPFVLEVAVHGGDTCRSSPFRVASKPTPLKPPPKRIRAPPPRRPTFSVAAGPEAAINEALNAAKRRCVAAPSPTLAPVGSPAAAVMGPPLSPMLAVVGAPQVADCDLQPLTSLDLDALLSLF